MSRKRLVAWIRWLIPLLAVFAIGWFVRSKMPFLHRGLSYVSEARIWPTILAILASLAAFVAMGQVMQKLLRAGGVKVPTADALALVMASNAWSTSIPGGQGVSALFSFTTMRRWGASAILCSWQILLSATLSTMWLIGLGAGAVFLLGANLSLTSLIVTLVFLFALTGVVAAVTWHPRLAIRPAMLVLRWYNRLRRRDEDEGSEVVLDHIDRLGAIHMTVPTFIVTAMWSLLNWVIDIAALWLCIQAVSMEENSLRVAACTLAFVTAKIAGSVQATPGGIGPVEAALTGALVATGMPAADAFAAVFLYRLITLFGMTLLGWLVYLVKFASSGFSARDVLSGKADVGNVGP